MAEVVIESKFWKAAMRSASVAKDSRLIFNKDYVFDNFVKQLFILNFVMFMSLEIKIFRNDTIPNTPMRQLIRTYPDLAEKVLDKCIKME